MPQKTIELLDSLEAVGFTDADFRILHHMPNVTIRAHRDYCIGVSAFIGENNRNVLARLELVERAYRLANFAQPARPGVLEALARAAVAEVPLRVGA